MHLGADGRLVSISQRLMGDTTPWIADLGVAPDGTPILLTALTDRARIRWGVSFGVPDHLVPATSGTFPEGEMYGIGSLEMAVGHGGIIYVAAAGSLVATCRGEKRWELRDPDSGWTGRIFGTRDGGVIAVTSAGPIQIDAAGNVNRVPGPTTMDSEFLRVFGGALSPSGLLLTRANAAATTFRYELWRDGSVTALHEAMDFRPPPLLDLEGVTFSESVQPSGLQGNYRRFVDGELSWERTGDLYFSEAFAPTASGLVLMTHGSNGVDEATSSILQLFDPRTPEMVWQEATLQGPYGTDGPPVYLSNASRGLVLGYDGVAYVIASQDWNYYIIAYQTDQLPYLDHCLIDGCDPSNTGSIALMR